MYGNVYDTYLETSVLSADPVELVRLLYRAALESIAKARRHLRDGDIAARSKEISRVIAILTELTISLDHQKGGSLGGTLAALYDYMQSLLLRANFEQSDPPLAEASRLLGTLLEGWDNCSAGAENGPEMACEPVGAG